MTDYIKPTGTTGKMMIRDTGTTIEFWLNSGDGSTHSENFFWGYTVNGVTNNGRQSTYVAGSGWFKLASWAVASDQTIVFRLFDTGTTAIGGPTTFTLNLVRAKLPAAPSQPTVSEVSSTSVIVSFVDGANNGGAIDERQIGYSITAHVVDGTIIPSDGSTLVTGLAPGTFYYFWARTHNSIGYSPWSVARGFTTSHIPDPPNPVIASNQTQTSIIVSFTDGASNGGLPITERELAYGTNPAGPDSMIPYDGVIQLDGLLPGKNYYFWARVKNSAGFSPYSQPIVARTIAGARINVSGVWKEAVPYVKDGGTWKLAQPWGRVAGVWKESL